jgi:hypothetical protein
MVAQNSTTHVRMYKNSVLLLRELNGYTGGKNPETLDRVLRFALSEYDNFKLRKQYQSLRPFGGNSLNNNKIGEDKQR